MKIDNSVLGNPSPSVLWLRNGAVMDRDYQNLTNNTVRLVKLIYHILEIILNRDSNA